MTELEPYLCLCERQDWNNPLRYQHNAETGKLVINLKTAKALGLSAVKRGANLIKITDVTGHKTQFGSIVWCARSWHRAAIARSGMQHGAPSSRFWRRFILRTAIAVRRHGRAVRY
jgi:hypothetical protein